MLLAEEYLKNAGRKMKLRSVCETKHKDIDTREEGDTHTPFGDVPSPKAITCIRNTFYFFVLSFVVAHSFSLDPR